MCVLGGRGSLDRGSVSESWEVQVRSGHLGEDVSPRLPWQVDLRPDLLSVTKLPDIHVCFHLWDL